MEVTEAIELLRAIAGQLRSNPPSFHYEINIIGTRVSNAGGIGILAAPQGGGPGSTTIGYQSSADVGNVDVTQKAVDADLRRQIDGAADKIELLAAAIERPKPERDRIRRLLSELPVKLIGAATVAAVTFAVNAALGGL